MARALSGTYYGAATVAAGLSGLDIVVVNSGSAAGGQALIALAAARRANTGASLEAIVLDSGSPEPAERRGRLPASQLPVRGVLTCSFGSAMVIHAGTGVTGLAWRWRDTESG